MRDKKCYEELRTAEREERESRLAAIFGGQLSYSEYIEGEKHLRTAVRRLLSDDTIGPDSSAVVVWYDPRMRTIRAKRCRPGRPRRATRPLTMRQQIVRLFLAADRRVAWCPECREWFARSTTKMKFCSDQCANRKRSRKYRERRGATQTIKTTRCAQGRAEAS